MRNSFQEILTELAGETPHALPLPVSVFKSFSSAIGSEDKIEYQMGHLSEVLFWVGANITNPVVFDDYKLIFENDADATLFKLRWL